jgi:two-component system, sensor histidine kinase and response regulator
MANILVVDDDRSTLEAVSTILRREGHEVITAASGSEALAHFQAEDIALVLSDIKMPHMDGLSLMKHIAEQHPNTPTILITGHGDRDLGLGALQSGAYAFIEKPLDREYFIAWLKRALQLRQLLVEVENKSRLLKHQAKTLERVVQELAFCEPIRRSLGSRPISFDRLNLAFHRPLTPTRNLLLIEGRYDLFAPSETVEKLWEAWERPEIWRLPHGHITALMSLPVLHRTVNWIRAAVGR